MRDGQYQILHVEDVRERFRNYRRMIKSALEEKHLPCQIQWAASLEDAFACIQEAEQDWDLILLDISLNDTQGKNGLELVRMLHQKGTNRIPIFVVSANIGRYQETLENFQKQQMILGYGEPLNDDWPGKLYDLLTGRQVSLLHLADLQDLLREEAVWEGLCRTAGQVDGVLVSGGLSSGGEYRGALDRLKALQGTLGLRPRHFVFAPGSRDRDLSCGDSRTFSRYLTFLEDFYGEDVPEESHCPGHELEEYDVVEQMYSELFSLMVYPERRTLVVSFNSVNPLERPEEGAVSCPVLGRDAPCGLVRAGKIAPQQLERVRRELEHLCQLHPEYHSFAKIALLHHNLFQSPRGADGRWNPPLANQGDLLALLSEFGFLLALHGHQRERTLHAYRASRRGWGLQVISAGPLARGFGANKITYRISTKGEITCFNLYELDWSGEEGLWRQNKIVLEE